jgi:sialic acid synthase SpsE
MNNYIELGSRVINAESRPYIIAEIGVNHEGSLDQAKELIDLAAEGGADAAKFQSYKAETLASKNSPSYWDTSKEPTKSQYQLFKKYDGFGPKEFKALADHCNQVGIDFLSTPFDNSAVEFLTPLVPFFKIASADITNIPFLRKVAQARKLVVLSTGASTLSEIDLAVHILKDEGVSKIALLHCILNYPTENKNAHLRMIEGLKHAYPEMIIGYSDHTLPNLSMSSLITAYLKGAIILEKHFTHNKLLPGNDHYHSMDINDLKNLVQRLDEINSLLGKDYIKKPIDSEKVARKNARRSLVAVRNLQAGHVISESDITYKRPGTGISPVHWDLVLGSSLRKEVSADHIFQWDDLILPV